MTETEQTFEEQLDTGNELEVLFPEYEYTLDTGEVITIKPVSMRHINKILRALRRLLTKYRELNEDERSQEEIIQELLYDSMDELLEMTYLCVSSKADRMAGEPVLDKIGPKDIPHVMNIIIRQNFHPDVLGNWMTLVTGLRDLMPAEMLKGLEEDAG